MRILVVGASGYIGGRLVPLLALRGHELVLMSRDARLLTARFAQARVVVADLLDPSTPGMFSSARAASASLLDAFVGRLIGG